MNARTRSACALFCAAILVVVWATERANDAANVYLGAALLCTGFALWALRRPDLSAAARDDAARSATCDARRALLAIVAVVVWSCVHDSLVAGNHVHLLSMLALSGLLLFWMQARPAQALPMRLRRHDLLPVTTLGLIVAGSFLVVDEEILLPDVVERWWQQAIESLVFAPVSEEVLYRGVLWYACRRFLSTRATILVTAAVFTLAHQWLELTFDGLPVIAAIAGLGLLMGLLRARTGSLAPGMIAHALANGLPRILAIL